MTTNPLGKSIETGEGILVYATNVVLAIAAVLPQGLSWTHTGLYLAILNGVHVLSRSLLKAFAIQRGVGIGAPVDFNPVDPEVVAGVAADVLDMMGQGHAAPFDQEKLPSHEEAGIPDSAVKPDPQPASA